MFSNPSATTSGAEPNKAPNFTHISRPLVHDRTNSNTSSSSSDVSTDAPNPDTSIYPDGKMSLAGISLRAMLLGTSLGLSASMALYLSTVYYTPLWRVPFFIASLSLFHFLEFYVTAQYNTRYATVSAFLLSSNGWAYNVAHGSAIVECIVSHVFWPGQTAAGRMITVTEPFFGSSVSLLLIVGFVLLLIGQVIRTVAMAQAASNFNHHVQSQHQEGHVLVNTGLYRYLRHPSYFGFFWWGLGTQLVLGDMVCFVGYALVLWQFFSSRIKRMLQIIFLGIELLLTGLRGCRRRSLLDLLLWGRVCSVQKSHLGWYPGNLAAGRYSIRYFEWSTYKETTGMCGNIWS
jgi:protein-S-isoprenylcysteine O-methyltransferase